MLSANSIFILIDGSCVSNYCSAVVVALELLQTVFCCGVGVGKSILFFIFISTIIVYSLR
jgi:hypothetical protein